MEDKDRVELDEWGDKEGSSWEEVAEELRIQEGRNLEEEDIRHYEWWGVV